MKAELTVTELSMRPFSEKRECFYCNMPIGQQHKADCVLIRKYVKVKLVVIYEIDVPSRWTKADTEFNRNGGTWCASNAIEELKKLEIEQGCLCRHTQFQCLKMDKSFFLDEECS